MWQMYLLLKPFHDLNLASHTPPICCCTSAPMVPPLLPHHHRGSPPRSWSPMPTCSRTCIPPARRCPQHQRLRPWCPSSSWRQLRPRWSWCIAVMVASLALAARSCCWSTSPAQGQRWRPQPRTWPRRRRRLHQWPQPSSPSPLLPLLPLASVLKKEKEKNLI